MERRHQVFISSTYGDLAQERAEIIQALLELDCIPAGMELFPATTVDAWELIKGVIDDSDYYCLVIGGRYGSLDASGISYTEKEYDYAMSQKKPIMAFLHVNPGNITAAKSEQTEAGRKKLSEFRGKVEAAHHRKQWSTALELGGLVSRSLVNLRKAHPAEGWVRGRFAATDALMVEIANLRVKVAEMKAAAAKPVDPETVVELKFASGADPYEPTISYIEKDKKTRSRAQIKTTWDTILKYVGPALVNECSKQELEDKLRLCFYHCAEKTLDIKLEHSSVIVPHVVVDQIQVQLQALGLISPGLKRRAVADKKTYWTLTGLGAKRLITVQAIAKATILIPGNAASAGLGALASFFSATSQAPINPAMG